MKRPSFHVCVFVPLKGGAYVVSVLDAEQYRNALRWQPPDRHIHVALVTSNRAEAEREAEQLRRVYGPAGEFVTLD